MFLFKLDKNSGFYGKKVSINLEKRWKLSISAVSLEIFLKICSIEMIIV